MADKTKQDKRRAKTARDSSSEDDAALFLRAMKDAKPLSKRRAAPPKAAPPSKASAPKTTASGRVKPVTAASPSRPPPAETKPDMPEIGAGDTAGVDARTMDRLKRGRLRPEATLDLHGMTRDEAHGAVSGFLSRSQAVGKRCVIVVTGRGRLSEGGGVLRNEFPMWLNQAGNRPKVLGFAQAQPRDGGSGAFYVLLRRIRNTEPGSTK